MSVFGQTASLRRLQNSNPADNATQSPKEAKPTDRGSRANHQKEEQPMKTLTQLGFRRKNQATLRDLFGIRAPVETRKNPQITPDTDYQPDAEREPQAPGFAGMWIDEFSNIGNVRNPLGSAMESGR